MRQLEALVQRLAVSTVLPRDLAENMAQAFQRVDRGFRLPPLASPQAKPSTTSVATSPITPNETSLDSSQVQSELAHLRPQLRTAKRKVWSLSSLIRAIYPFIIAVLSSFLSCPQNADSAPASAPGPGTAGFSKQSQRGALLSAGTGHTAQISI